MVTKFWREKRKLSLFTMFEEKVTLLKKYIHDKTQGKCSPPWNWLFTRLASLLSRYPSGITRAIILAEIQQSWIQYSQYHGRFDGQKTRKISVDSLYESRHIGYESILEATVECIQSVPGTLTRIAILQDCINGNCKLSRSTLGMYLHQKLYQVQESLLLKRTLRFTSCRLVQSQGLSSSRQKLCLLPTENFLILLSENEEPKLEKASSLEGIDNKPYPHYSHNVKVEVADLGTEETVHFPNGQTSIKRCIKVVDSEGVHTSLILWDEQLPLASLFKEGDTLIIQQPFVIPNQAEMFYLEYGPASVIFCISLDPVIEMVPSQASQIHPTPVSVLKDSSGTLDFSTFPDQIFIADIRPQISRVTIFCIIKDISSVEAFTEDHVSGHKFTLTTQDRTGCQSITVYDDTKACYHSLYTGQGILLENLHTSGSSPSSSLVLEMHQSGKIWNVSAMSGWLTTKCVSSPITVKDIKQYGNCACKAVITKVYSVGGNPVSRVHVSCHSKVQCYSGCFSCQKCGVTHLNEMLNKPGQQNSPSMHWMWQNNLSLEIHDSHSSMDVCLTDQTSEQLLQMNVPQFASLLKNSQEQVLESLLAQEFIFGISCFGGRCRIDAICPTN